MLSIFDAHVHLFDGTVNNHPFLKQEDPTFNVIIGDYSALPRRYLPDDYLKDSASYQVEGIVWYEFLSTDPIKEARWGQRLADTSPLHHAMVVLVNFLDPTLEERLEIYAALPNVVAVRQHLGWDTGNALRHFAARPDLLTNTTWRKGLGKLRQYRFKCGLEVFAPQLCELHDVICLYPEISFTLAVMGWPLDLSSDGYARWQQDMVALSRCENVCVEIAAIECIFGRDWRQEQVAPWLLSIIDMFSPARCMLGSHMPIANLSVGFERLYHAYQEILVGFSKTEREDLFRNTAATWFKRVEC